MYGLAQLQYGMRSRKVFIPVIHQITEVNVLKQLQTFDFYQQTSV